MKKYPSENLPINSFGGILTRTVSGLSLDRLSQDKSGDLDMISRVDLANAMHGATLDDVIEVLSFFADLNGENCDHLKALFLVELINRDFLVNPDAVVASIAAGLENAFRDRKEYLASMMHKVDELLNEDPDKNGDTTKGVKVLSVQALIKKLVEANAS